MQVSTREPEFLFTEEDVIQKSPLAAAFVRERRRLNDIVAAAENKFVGRYYNLDHNTYLQGELDAKVKEFLGLGVSAALRCDDCILYHIIQGYRLGATRGQLQETLNVALMVGGSIVIPHLRRAYAVLEELYQ